MRRVICLVRPTGHSAAARQAAPVATHFHAVAQPPVAGREGRRRCARCCGCITSATRPEASDRSRDWYRSERAGVRARRRGSGIAFARGRRVNLELTRSISWRRCVSVRQRARALPRSVRDHEQLHPARGALPATETPAARMGAEGRMADPALTHTRPDAPLAGGAHAPRRGVAAPNALLEAALRDEPTAFSFFQAVRLMSRLRPERAPVGGGPTRPAKSRDSRRARHWDSRPARSSRSRCRTMRRRTVRHRLPGWS